MAPTAAIKMKELEQRTGFNREAIRFYIREGLLPQPDKPKRNVAFYSELHIKRLLAVKYLQQERDMSLAKIKALLTTGEFDNLANPASLKGLEQLLPALVDGIAPVKDQKLSELIADNSLSMVEVRAMELSNVITIISKQDGDYVSFRDAIILEKWDEARRAGYTPERGYSVELLSLYQQTIAQLAQYETEQFFSNFSGEVNSDEAAVVVAKGIELANEILKQLHTKALVKAIDQKLQ